MTEPPSAPGAVPVPVPAATPARHGAAGYAVLAWLAATGARFAWAAVTGFQNAGIPWWSKIATAAVALLGLAAVVPFLRFRRSGWEMAMWVLVTALVMDVARIVLGTRSWVLAALAAGASAFCLGYAWRARHAFPDHDHDHGMDDGHLRPAVASGAEPAAASPSAHSATVEDVLGAIHRRIVEAGSACAVGREALVAEAVRHGVRAEMLRREGLPLYRTFLDHFLADGPLTAEEDRELFCLESKLELDAIAVARLRAERGADRKAPHPPLAAEPVEAHAAVPHPSASAEPVPIASAAPAGEDPTVEMTYTPGLAGVAQAGGAPGLADYEEHELAALLGWAGIALPPDAEPRPALETLRALHHVSTVPLDEVDPGHPLDAGERCYAVRTVELYRMGPGAPADAAADAGDAVDPLAFVDGSLERDCNLSRYQRAGACRFLATDRRLLLVAPSGQQSPLPLERIRSVHPHRNGLEVRPLRGNPVFLAFTDGVADVAMRIRRALLERRGAPPA